MLCPYVSKHNSSNTNKDTHEYIYIYIYIYIYYVWENSLYKKHSVRLIRKGLDLPPLSHGCFSKAHVREGSMKVSVKG